MVKDGKKSTGSDPKKKPFLHYPQNPNTCMLKKYFPNQVISSGAMNCFNVMPVELRRGEMNCFYLCISICDI